MNTIIKVKGMSCQHCVMAVKKALTSVDGVKDVNVSLENAEATLTHDGPIDVKEANRQVEKAGYEVG
jgi:copper chaperone